MLYGLDPTIVHVRRAIKTYGIGVIKPFIHGEHPQGMYIHTYLNMYVVSIHIILNKIYHLAESFIGGFR